MLERSMLAESIGYAALLGASVSGSVLLAAAGAVVAGTLAKVWPGACRFGLAAHDHAVAPDVRCIMGAWSLHLESAAWGSRGPAPHYATRARAVWTQLPVPGTRCRGCGATGCESGRVELTRAAAQADADWIVAMSVHFDTPEGRVALNRFRTEHAPPEAWHRAHYTFTEDQTERA